VFYFAARYSKQLAVMFVDLDLFQENQPRLRPRDWRQTPAISGICLLASVRQSDTVSRLRGDEFAVQLSQVERAEDTVFIAKKILSALAAPYSIDQKRLDINASIGVSTYPANLARKRNVDFGLILVKYGLERILFRLSRSRHRDVFILKGALLFELWTEQRCRPTRDADFLARGDNAPERFTHIFRELCVLEVDEDGLRFDAWTIEAERISEDADYEGVRVTFLVYLERAKIPIQSDIGFGDIVTPAPSEIGYPTLLEFPSPRFWPIRKKRSLPKNSKYL
jgi:diguanylate cyclase (GGDEF)-like protein